MTSEQIAEIREWIASPAAGGMVPIQARRLSRILDEREALLNFAKRMDRTLDVSLYHSERAECAAAIAKAESP